MQEVIAGAHPVWLVNAERRATDRRNGQDRRGAGGIAVPVRVIEHNGDGQAPAVRTSMPSALGVGTRKAVYVAVPGAQLSGTSGQAAKVFAAIAGAEQHGKTAEELRKELKLKAKSLESALYRLKLAGVVRAFNFADVRARA